jgi:hypothetical protein
VNGIRTLINVVIVDPIQVDLVLGLAFPCGMVVTMVAQMKEGLYHECYLANMFFLIAIEDFECLYQ